MTILFTMTPAFNPDNGGVQRTTSKLSKKFSELGHDVHIYSSAKTGHVEFGFAKIHGAVEEGGERNSINIVMLEEVIHQITPDIVINQMPYIVEFQNAFMRAKRRTDFYLIGCLRNSLYSVKNNLELTMQKVFPLILFRLLNHAPGRYIYLQIHRFLNRRKLRRILNVHDQFVLLVPANFEELKYFVGSYKADKVIWIPNSIPSINKVATPREKIILHVGRLNDKQKRSDLLVPFWKHTYGELPDWKFVIVGDGEYMAQLRKEIEANHLERIELVGFQEPGVYYERASVFMMPSSYEGFPNTFIEAQSYGLPCLAFNSYPAISWIGNNDQDCQLIDAFDTEQMAKAALKICRDDKRLRKMSDAAYTNAEQFTIDRVGERWQRFFEEIENRSV